MMHEGVCFHIMIREVVVVVGAVQETMATITIQITHKSKLVQTLHPILCKGAASTLFPFLPKLILRSLCADPIRQLE
jgi:hypothetical protein